LRIEFPLKRGKEMKKSIYLFLLVIFVASTSTWGCSGQSAREMFETAQFEELQRNDEHAEELYMKILKEYPESDYAAKAEEKLRELRKKQNE
jgi:outer membrane protein assembly factor BamD (BamD/ComL family)